MLSSTRQARLSRSGSGVPTISCASMSTTRHPSPPVLTNAPADAEAGRGLVLVAELSAEWGSYRTLVGKVVYFTFAFQLDPGRAAP
jgi:hypothetical protein